MIRRSMNDQRSGCFDLTSCFCFCCFWDKICDEREWVSYIKDNKLLWCSIDKHWVLPLHWLLPTVVQFNVSIYTWNLKQYVYFVNQWLRSKLSNCFVHPKTNWTDLVPTIKVLQFRPNKWPILTKLKICW